MVLFGRRHRKQGDSGRFAGEIDDARIYDRALTIDQIAALSPNQPSVIAPWAWWTFEDRSASAGLSDQVAALNAKQADFDNDGNLDVLLLRGGWEQPRRPSLMRSSFNDTIGLEGDIGGIKHANSPVLDIYYPGKLALSKARAIRRPDASRLSRGWLAPTRHHFWGRPC